MQGEADILEQIEAVSVLLGLPAYVIEKDFYVTQAISIVTQVKHDNFDLVFQGGTSLAKAHRIIHRMSEDCDFRVRAQNADSLSKEGKRKLLQNFRHDLVHNLKKKGFEIKREETKVHNEGQFMSLRVWYSSAFVPPEGIKPYLALEFFLGDVKTPTESKPVTTLVQQVLGEQVQHSVTQVDSVSVIETAAEKWVALTRRISVMKHHNHYYDTHLVRHLYDLYEIERAGLFTKEFEKLVPHIVLYDRKQYRSRNDAYYRDPVGEIERALTELKTSADWQRHWERFMNDMVYDKKKPTYEQAMTNLQNKSSLALSQMSNLKLEY